jgi:hypothetical protein
MSAEVIQMLIPIVAIAVTFMFPVALVATLKFFKLKERELQMEMESRKFTGQALEQRVQRLESVLLALDADLRAKLSAAVPHAGLMEGPGSSQAEQPGPVMDPASRVR